MKRLSSLFCLLFLANFAILAQNPNSAYRLPLTPDMPEWAKELYRGDSSLNVLELDAAFAPWAATYDSLKVAVAKAGDQASEVLKQQLGHYKRYYKYYTRWRARVYDNLQPDGSLNFNIPVKTYFAPSEAARQEATSSSNWSFLGPVVTRWRQNDNAAQPLAPWQVNVYSMDVAPSDPNTLYCGSETGVVNKTVDKGQNWTTVGTDYFTNNIGAIAIHPTDPNTVYVSELSSKIAQTTNGGASWTTVLTISGFNCEDIKIKPDEPEVVLAAGSSLRRRTAGNVWTNVLNKRVYDVAFKPGTPSMVVYALVENTSLDLCEFWKSTDGGQTWSIRSTGWISGLTNGGGRLTVTPADNNRIYAALLTGSGPRIMRSDDAGESWSIVASSSLSNLTGSNVTGLLGMSNGQGYYDLSVVASHTDANQVIVGTTSAYKSTDGGSTWAPLGGYHGPFAIHPDIQEMVANGTDTWIATDGGMNLSTDFYTNSSFGVNYFVRINNLRGSEHWGFDIGWNEDVLVGGRYHNGNTAWRESYPAGDFLRMGGGEAPTGYVNPGNPSLTYFSDLGGRILPTNNSQAVGSFTVNKWPNESFYPMEGAEQKWDPRYMYTYYLGQGNQFWKTTDNGLSFTALFTHSDASAEIRYVEVSRSNPDVIYFTAFVPSPAVDGELWKTTDGGQNWTKCNNPGTLTANERRFSKITLSGTDANTLWWCFRTGPNGQKIFKSTDGGQSWANWTTSTLNNVPASDVLHQLGTNGGVYYLSGSGGKVYYRDDASTDWTVYNAGLPLNLNGDFQGVLGKAYYKGGKLRLATGHGIWEADLYTPSTTTLVQPMVDNGTPACTRDTLQLESYSAINGSATYQWILSPAPHWISAPNIRNPRVVLGTEASYSVTLSVTDANGTSTRTINDFITFPTGNLCGADTISGKSLVLDGSGDYALANQRLNLNSNTVTITAWIKRDGNQTDFAGLVNARGGSTNSGLSITNTNQLRYTWNDAVGSYSFNTNLTVPDKTWTHIALVITSSSATVYMNGRAVTRTATHPIEEFNTPLQIGYDNGSRYFKGEIDEVTVWNRSLTTNEIRLLMHHTVNLATASNLVAYYQFNEPSGVANDKVGVRHATLVGNAARVASTGPFGGGASAIQNITGSGAVNFPGTGVIIGFPISGIYPGGDVVVSRINLAPDSLPPCSNYASDNHYWIIENFGANPTFGALDSIRFTNINVPPTANIPATSYQLNRRTLGTAVAGTANGMANAHLLPWTPHSSTSLRAIGGSAGSITFGSASNITQFGQFLATNPLAGPIISGPTSVCNGGNATLDAGAGYIAYAWSNGGGSDQTAIYNNITSSTTYAVTVTDVANCQGVAMYTVSVVDNTPPMAVCQNITVNFSNPTTTVTPAQINNGSSDDCVTLNLAGLTPNTFTCSNIGTNTVTLTVSDGNNNTATCSATVTIQTAEVNVRGNGMNITDGNNMPSVADHTDFGQTTGASIARTFTIQNTGTVASLPVTNISLSGTNSDQFSIATLTPASPIPPGQSATFTVTYAPNATGIHNAAITITNGACNGGIYDFAIRGELTCSSPTFTACPTAMVELNTPTNGCTATATYNIAANGLPTPTLTYAFSGATTGSGNGTGSGAYFNKGITTVTVTATNPCGAPTCAFSVQVTDNIPPSITCPTPTTVSNTPGQCGAILTYAPTVTDNCSGVTFAVTGGLASGSLFPIGNTTVQLQATDAVGLTATCSFTVRVNDTEQPGIVCPANIIRANDAGQCNAVVSYVNPTYSDNCPGAGLDHLNGGLSGSIFPVGTTTVTWMATDAANNTRTCTFTIAVNDTQAPNLSCPANQSVSTTSGTCTATVAYAPTASDNCTANPSLQHSFSGATTKALTAGSGSGSTFGKGITTVTLRATDGAGLTKTCTFRVIVSDTEKPVIPTCPTMAPVNTAPGLCTATVTYSNPTFTDNCAPTSGTTTRISGPASGSAFSVGTTNVTFRATDAASNSTTCVMAITVVDNQPPTISCPASVTATGNGTPCTSVVFYGAPTASDNCAGTLTPFLVGGLGSGSTFPLGTTNNVWRAVAPNGQTAECTVSVTVNCAPSAPGTAEGRANAVGQRPEALDFSLNPNPSDEVVQIAWANANPAPVRLTIYDVRGQLIWAQTTATGEQTLRLDVSNWTTGVYLVSLRGKGGVVTKRLVVTH